MTFVFCEIGKESHKQIKQFFLILLICTITIIIFSMNLNNNSIIYKDDSNNKPFNGCTADSITIGMSGYKETVVNQFDGEEVQPLPETIVSGPIGDGVTPGCGVPVAQVAGRQMAKKAARGHNCCMEEDVNFVLIMDEVLPIWSRIVVKHNSLNPDINCVGERNEVSI